MQDLNTGVKVSSWTLKHLEANKRVSDRARKKMEVSLTAEPVEKVQMANSDNFGTVKNQQLTGHRKPQNAQI